MALPTATQRRAGQARVKAMKIPDLYVLTDAANTDSEHHLQAKEWFERETEGGLPTK